MTSGGASDLPTPAVIRRGGGMWTPAQAIPLRGPAESAEQSRQARNENRLCACRIGRQLAGFSRRCLFTDIVGSTEHAAGLGDRAWRDLLERHHALVRRELGGFHGREIGHVGGRVPGRCSRRRSAAGGAAEAITSSVVFAGAGRCGPGCTPGSARWPAGAGTAGWRCTSARGWPRWPGRARCW